MYFIVAKMEKKSIWTILNVAPLSLIRNRRIYRTLSFTILPFCSWQMRQDGKRKR